MGERALRSETLASSYVYQPDHSYADFVFRLHSDLTHAIDVAGTRCAVCTVSGRNCPCTLSIIHRLVAISWSFHKIVHLSCTASTIEQNVSTSAECFHAKGSSLPQCGQAFPCNHDTLHHNCISCIITQVLILGL